MPVVVVDVANVMGARADGWWRDRAGAALRLGREVTALASRPAGEPAEASAWVLVLEGRARDCAPALAEEAALAREAAGEAAVPVRVVSAPGHGDDAVVTAAAAAVAEGQGCLVVTADRELRERCEDVGASVAGPGWLLGRL